MCKKIGFPNPCVIQESTVITTEVIENPCDCENKEVKRMNCFRRKKMCSVMSTECLVKVRTELNMVF